MFGFLFGALIVDFLWVLLVFTIYSILGITPEDKAPTRFIEPSVFSLLIFFPLAAFEEYFFRMIPLSIGLLMFGKTKKVLFVAGIASLIFGYVHLGFISIPVQGVGGFILCIVYLKCGGWEAARYKPLLCTTLIHAVYNITLQIPDLIN